MKLHSLGFLLLLALTTPTYSLRPSTQKASCCDMQSKSIWIYDPITSLTTRISEASTCQEKCQVNKAIVQEWKEGNLFFYAEMCNDDRNRPSLCTYEIDRFDLNALSDHQITALLSFRDKTCAERVEQEEKAPESLLVNLYKTVVGAAKNALRRNKITSMEKELYEVNEQAQSSSLEVNDWALNQSSAHIGKEHETIEVYVESIVYESEESVHTNSSSQAGQRTGIRGKKKSVAKSEPIVVPSKYAAHLRGANSSANASPEGDGCEDGERNMPAEVVCNFRGCEKRYAMLNMRSLEL